jgi:hypothetical protein
MVALPKTFALAAIVILMTYSLLDASLGFVLVFLLWKIYSRSSPPSHPPGPKGWPLIGNLFDMPKEKAWNVFTQLSKEYGAFSYLSGL